MKKGIILLLTCFVLAVLLASPQPAWAASAASELRLTGDESIQLTGETLLVDLAGYDLTVTGEGSIELIDTANDGYDETACGTLTVDGEITVANYATSSDGSTYVTVTEGASLSAHRLDMCLTAVSLRTSAAGLYYKARYTCDPVLAAQVQSYGVVLSVHNMPGADFKTEPMAGNNNCYTVAATPFESGVEATSGAVFNILRQSLDAQSNLQRSQQVIYANAYIDLGSGPIVADMENAGKTVDDSEFDGVAYSLQDLLQLLDGNYYNYERNSRTLVDGFCKQWVESGVSWNFAQIGNTVAGMVDNSNIEEKFQSGTTDAVCPVCQVEVTWTPIYSDASAYDLGPDETQTHYYLAEDVTYTGTSTFFQSRVKTGSTCFHLNGHNLTATKAKAFFGSNSRTNIMGNGIVTGYQSAAGQGAALQINNSVSTNGIYVYGGTYRKTSNSNAEAAVVCIHTVGSTINLYDDVTIDAPESKAIQVQIPTGKNAWLGLYGCTVNGDVELLGANTKTSTAEFVDCIISGNVTVAEGSAVYLAGNPVIQSVTLAESTPLTLKGLSLGASVGIVNEGVFTTQTENPKAYVNYFYCVDENKDITFREDVLYCGIDYIGSIEIKFLPGTTNAVCPVCQVEVTWIPIYDGADAYNLAADETQTHYYLAEDVTYTGTSTFFQSQSKVAATCFHLNGHNLTATKAKAFFGSNSLTSILGNGIVTGYQSGADEGAALQINNSIATNGLHVYGGTYRKTDDSNKDASVVCISTVGSTIKLYEDVIIDAPESTAIRVSIPTKKNAQLDVYGSTVNGNVLLLGTAEGSYTASATFTDCVINGAVDVASGSNVTLCGAVQIEKLTVAAGELISIGEPTADAALTVSASGTFTKEVEQPEDWLQYITCAEEGDWIIVRNEQLYQGPRQTLTPATQEDQEVLETAYAGTTAKHGDFHGHTSTAGADGKNSLAEWKAEIDRLKIDFATVVDHRQSIHMHDAEFSADYFIGGSEPGTALLDSKAEIAQFDYSMVFADVEKFETLLEKWSDVNKLYVDENYTGYRFKSTYYSLAMTTAKFQELMQDVYNAGGIMILVHPKNKGYLTSDDPLDYFFGENSCMEISTGLKLSNGDGGNMCAPANEKAYRLWVELLRLGKKIWATAGSDSHTLPNTSGLNTVYTAEDHREDYIAALRSGNTAPGWVGIRMDIGGTVMGGQTDFTDQRLVFSVGDIYTGDAGEEDPVYQADHTYRVELYDDSGLLMEYTIDPTQMNYFALDCDATAMFYRIVVWDDTANTRVGVSNPIWNTAN